MRRFFASTTNEISELERKNQESVRALAGECMVLLENDGTLPLGKETKKLALYGNGVRHMVKGGTGSGDVNTRGVTHVEKGIEEAGIEVVSKEWLNRYDAEIVRTQSVYMEYVKRKAKGKGISMVGVMLSEQYQAPDVIEITEDRSDITDTAVYILARNSGEGSDRYAKPGDYYLTDGEKKAIRFLAETYRRFILVLNIGGIIDTSVIRSISGINAVLLAGQMGNMGGRIIADVLMGKTIPSGKLSDTWAISYGDYPSSKDFSHNNGNLDDEYYTEGIFVGYRYFDTFNITPAYCFGYGGSYTDFTIRTLQTRVDGGKIYLEAEVVNTGDTYAGKEVVQVYYSAPKGELEKPYQELAVFAKTRLLHPGESQILALVFPIKEMASYDPKKHAWILEKGDYILRVGSSSRDTRIAAVLVLDRTKRTVQLGDVLSEQEKIREISAKDAFSYSYLTEQEELKNAERILIPPDAISVENVEYHKERVLYEERLEMQPVTLLDVKEGKAEVEDLIAQLSIDEMAMLCVGTERLENMGQNVVGSSAKLVPGAAGETDSSLMEKRGIYPMILADGPAGLRLQPHFKATSEGDILKGGDIFGISVEPFPDDLPEDVIDYYQYCTAIPIANTLSQSWDMELIQKMGEIIGKEMKKFHIHLWLAPGMNIHRNPLCGRNFEYYSEDPLLTGKCAAACTNGVQKNGGQGTTIKHYLCNNQEDNRMFVNVHVKERALREIYMKGFEIAVKESKPYAMMTSYNLLNGNHAANHRGILDAARQEWGFDGFIMTDWYASQDTSFMEAVSDIYPYSSAVQCIKAGNDLQMPGCAENVADIIEGVRNGTEITKADLQFCVRNILRVMLKCM